VAVFYSSGWAETRTYCRRRLIHELRVVKELPSVRLGGLVLATLYRFLFAIAKLRAVGKVSLRKIHFLPPILNKPEGAGLSKGWSRRPPEDLSSWNEVRLVTRIQTLL
jgi:hypothetical protein